MNDDKTVYPSHDTHPFRMPIEQIYTLENVGLMVVGPIQESGRLKEGDRILIIGSDKTLTTHITGIDIRGDALGLKLADNVTQDQLTTGMFVTTAGA